MLKVTLDNYIIQEDKVPLEKVIESDFSLCLQNIDENSYYAIVVKDSTDNDVDYIHFLSVNIPGSDIRKGEVIVKPVKIQEQERKYIFELFEGFLPTGLTMYEFFLECPQLDLVSSCSIVTRKKAKPVRKFVTPSKLLRSQRVV